MASSSDRAAATAHAKAAEARTLAATSRDRAMTGGSVFQIGEHSRQLGPYSVRLAVDDAARAAAPRRLAQAVAQPPQYEDLLVRGSTKHGAQAQLGLRFHGPAPLMAPCWVGLCTRPWTYGLSKWGNHTVGGKHCCADMLMPGCVPSACRRTRNGCFGCCPKGWAHSTSKWHRQRRICAGSAAFTQARSGASPFWDSRSTGCQSGTVSPRHAAHCAQEAPSRLPPAHGMDQATPARAGAGVLPADACATTRPLQRLL